MRNSNGTSWIDRQMEWTTQVDEDLVRKSLDLPKRGPMNVVNGMTWKELVVIAAIVGGVGWGAMRLAKPDVLSPPPVTNLTDAEYDVLFYDAQGNPIHLDRWSGSSRTEE